MTTTTETVAPENGERAITEPTVEVTPDGTDALGDAGKKALDAMKAERNAARKEAADAKAEADRLKAAAEGKEAAWQAEQDARKEADRRYAERVRNAEVKAAATGKLSDPADALKFLDLNQFEIDDNGDVDASAIESAIAALVESKPYLAATAKERFQGTADQGARNADQRSDEQKLLDDIATAESAGNVALSIALKQRLHGLRASNQKG